MLWQTACSLGMLTGLSGYGGAASWVLLRLGVQGTTLNCFPPYSEAGKAPWFLKGPPGRHGRAGVLKATAPPPGALVLPCDLDGLLLWAAVNVTDCLQSPVMPMAMVPCNVLLACLRIGSLGGGAVFGMDSGT